MSGIVIPAAQFDSLPDDNAPQATAQASAGPTTLPADQFDALQDDSDKYGTAEEQTKAGLEGVARGVSLGTSDLAETKLGLATPEAIKGRSEANPVTSTVGQIVGGAGLIGATGGAGALAEGAGLAGTIGAGALEGAAFGGGNAVSDYALNGDLTAQKVVSDVGMGALLGGSLGALAKGAEYALPKATESVSKALRSTLGLGKAAPEELSEGAQAIVDAPPAAKVRQTGVQPTSYQDIIDRVAAAKANGVSVELPQAAELDDALSRVEMENPVHPLQRDSLSSQSARDEYNTYKEMPGVEGQALTANEGIQKNELVGKNDSTIQNISPHATLTADPVEAGANAAEAFTDAIQSKRDAIGPQIADFKNADVNYYHTPGVIDALTNPDMPHGNPKIANMFEEGTSKIQIKPFDTGMGIAKKTYSNVSDMVDALEKNPTDFGKLFDIRKGLTDGVNPLEMGGAGSELTQAKAAMMDYMQNASENPNIRDAMAGYAKNEEDAKYIEKVFGAEVGTDNFRSIARNKPEEAITKKIFANTNNVQVAKRILPPEKFNEILGDFLTKARSDVTDKGVFSSNKFGSFLKKNAPALQEAFSDNPAALQRLKDINTIMRILPDAPSINPSGTAKTLLGHLKNSASFEQMAANALGFLKDKTVGKVQEQMALSGLNERLAGRAEAANTASKLSDLADKVGKQISSMSKDIFQNNSSRGAAVGGLVVPTVKDFDNKTKRIKELSANPQAMMDHVSAVTQPVTAAAPTVGQGLSTAMVKGVGFLNSKIPRPNNQFALSEDWQPSKSQIDKFNKYYESVNSPLNALSQIKNGSLSNEMMEGLNQVHPDLLQEMQKEVMSNIGKEKAQNLNYGSKIALSKFIGHPLDESLTPQAIQANQLSMNGPDQSQQGAAQPAQSGRTRQRSTLGGLKQINVANRAQTQTQELEEPET